VSFAMKITAYATQGAYRRSAARTGVRSSMSTKEEDGRMVAVLSAITILWGARLLAIRQRGGNEPSVRCRQLRHWG
jgi:hypothetical protein